MESVAERHGFRAISALPTAPPLPVGRLLTAGLDSCTDLLTHPCISFFFHFHFLPSLQQWMQPASLPCYGAAQIKISADAPIASSALCRHMCLHHFNCSTDSPNQYFPAALCSSDIDPSALWPSSKAYIPPPSCGLTAGHPSPSLAPVAPVVNVWRLRPIPPKSPKCSQELCDRGEGAWTLELDRKALTGSPTVS